MTFAEAISERGDKVAARLVRQERTEWGFAEVVSVAPLQIRMEGYTEPETRSPVACTPVSVGDHVRTATFKNQTTIWNVGAAQGAGWTAPAGMFASGFTGSVFVEKVGRDVEISVDVTGTFGVGTSNFLGAIPSEFRPTSGLNGWGPAYFTGGYSGTLWCRPDGTMAAAHQSGASHGRVQGSIRFFVED